MSLMESIVASLKKDEDFKQAQKARKVERILNEREKSSNERVLEKFIEEKRQDSIKKKLDKINKERNDELFNKKFVPDKNIFKNQKNILRGHSSMLQQNNILRGKNLFFK